MASSPERAPTPHETSPVQKHVVALLFLVFAVYAPALGNGFTLDDRAIAAATVPVSGEVDPVIGELQSPVFYFTHHYWHPHMENDGLFRPITVWSFALTYQLFSRWLPPTWEAFPHHLLNVLLHLWATWLVAQLLLRLGLPARMSLLTAALFGLHAIHSEAVIGIVGRAELFGFCFGAAAILSFVRGGRGRAVAAGAWLFLAICSKESALAWVPFLPCYLLARAWLQDGDQSPSHVLRPHLARMIGVAMGAIVSWLPLWLNIQADARNRPAPFHANELAHLPDLTRILTSIEIWGYGLYECVAPFWLACLYGPMVVPTVESALEPGFLLAVVVLLGILIGGLGCARRAPLAFLGMAWFLGFSLVTSNVLFPIGTSFAERLYYTPSLGICLLPAVILGCRQDRRQGRQQGRQRDRLMLAVIVPVLAWLAVNVVVIVRRDFDWRDDATLFLADVQVNPRSLDLNRKAASVYATGPKADPATAMRYLKNAVTLNRDDCLAWKEIGDLQLRQRRFREALQSFENVLASRYVEFAGDTDALAHVGIGHCWIGLQDLDKAMAAFRSSDAAQPVNPVAAVGIGRVHLMRRDVHRAVAAFRRALTFSPGFRDAWVQLASYAPDVLPRADVQRLFDEGLRRFRGEPHMSMLIGGMGHRANLDPRRVAAVLEAAIGRLPPAAQRDYNTFTARLYLAATLERLGRVDRAVQAYRWLAADGACPAEVRRAATDRISALRKRD